MKVYCFNTDNKILVTESYFDQSTSISCDTKSVTLSNGVITSTNKSTYSNAFYYTYQCLTITPTSETPTPKLKTPTQSPTPKPYHTQIITPFNVRYYLRF